jgi:hypothetical protein
MTFRFEYLDRPLTILNSSEFYNELTNLLVTEGNKETLQTLSNLLLPITKLDATACKGKIEHKIFIERIRGFFNFRSSFTC